MTGDTIRYDLDRERRILRVAQRSPAHPMEAEAMKAAASLTRFAPRSIPAFRDALYDACPYRASWLYNILNGKAAESLLPV